MRTTVPARSSPFAAPASSSRLRLPACCVWMCPRALPKATHAARCSTCVRALPVPAARARGAARLVAAAQRRGGVGRPGLGHLRRSRVVVGRTSLELALTSAGSGFANVRFDVRPSKSVYACYVHNATRYGAHGHPLHTLRRTGSANPCRQGVQTPARRRRALTPRRAGPARARAA